MPFITKARITRWVQPDPAKPKSKWKRVTKGTPGAVKVTDVAETYTIVDESTSPDADQHRLHPQGTRPGSPGRLQGR